MLTFFESKHSLTIRLTFGEFYVLTVATKKNREAILQQKRNLALKIP